MTKMKLREFGDTALSFLMISLGALLIYIPIKLWDFLVTEQYRPTVRPFYPVIYGAFAVAGIIIAVLGILAHTASSWIDPTPWVMVISLTGSAGLNPAVV